MDARELCERLLVAPNEDEVIPILTQAGYWDDPRAWRNFGDRENNFSTIGNQQAHAEAALVEKLVNSIDAVLTLECRSRGIDPEGTDAPRTIKNAVSQFFGIRDGNLSELTATELTAIAGRIGIVATGTRTSPNLTVIDTGEGQSPPEFPGTFLSLDSENKLKTPFVQGKFNMGGTGVLQFCGRRNLQLVVSRRHPDLAPTSNDWGFTLVRRDDPSGNIKSSRYRYLAPSGRILSFPHTAPFQPRLDESIPGTAPLPTLEWGSIIKLYDYQLPGGAKTNILFDLFNHLSCLMPGVALPIRFYERRNYSGNSFESTLVGLEVRLDRDTADNLEFQPTAHTILPDDLRLPVRLYAFKRRPEGSASAKFRNREGVIFVVNGQAHGFLDKAFFRRGRLNLSYVADDLLMLVDGTGLSGRDREDLFMNSRDRLREGPLKQQIERALEDLLKEHQLLRELNAARREELLGKKLEEDQALESILQEIILRSPVLVALFITGKKIADPTSSVPGKESILNFTGKRFPTYFRIAKGNTVRSARLGQRFKVQFETDAENMYLYRQEEPGEYTLNLNGSAVADSVMNLMNGVATLNVSLPSETKAGETLRWLGEVTDPSRVQPFEFEIERKIEPAVTASGGRGGRRKPPSEEGGGDREENAKLALPPIVSVRKPDWGAHGFDGESALAVKRNPDGAYDFYVNLDNKFLAAEVRSRPGKREVLEAQFKYGFALFGLAALREADTTETTGDPEEFVRGLSRSFSPFLLPMIAGLAELDDVQAPEDEGPDASQDGQT